MIWLYSLSDVSPDISSAQIPSWIVIVGGVKFGTSGISKSAWENLVDWISGVSDLLRFLFSFPLFLTRAQDSNPS